MEQKFNSFVIFAAMRTGSNFLEQSLNAVEGITSHGEAFNPVFIAYPNHKTLLGMTMAERDATPMALWDQVRAAPGLNGFRYFPDHDPRVLDAILADKDCAKIILNRNPLESYTSLKIARETGQWKLKDARRLKSAKAEFDAAEFSEHLAQLQEFQLRVLSALQKTGQTAFYLDYEDIGDAEVLRGLVSFLGLEGAKVSPTRSMVPQNPVPILQKVSNPEVMARSLAQLDRFDLTRTPNFEPRRGPSVPGFIAAKGAALLFMPLPSGPTAIVERWLASLGADNAKGVITGFTQSSLRDWMRSHGGTHRRFTVLRHPVARAHRAFCDLVLSGEFPEFTDHLQRGYNLNLTPHGAELPVADHRAGFVQFLRFAKSSLNGQTSLRVNPLWASQSALVAGFSGFAAPDMVIREEDLAEDLAGLCRKVGARWVPLADLPAPDIARLSEIYGDDVEQLTRQAYQRDYVTFGFSDWSEPGRR
jgi:LPS sulfotransferase NodH